MSLVHDTWPIARAGEALAALATHAGLLAHAQAPAAPDPSLLAELEGAALERWFLGASAGLGLEAEAIDSDLAGVDDLLRGSPPALLRLGANGDELLLVLRGGSRMLTVLPPDLRPRRVALAELRRVVCEPVIAAARPQAESLVERTGIRGARRARAIEALLRQHFGARRVGRAFLLRASPATSWTRLLRAEGVLGRVVALAGLHALELALTITAWWLIGGLVFAGRSDPGWSHAWLLLLLSLVPCRMGQTAISGEILRRAGALLKRRLLVGAMAMTGDLTRREGAGALLGRVLETAAVESLGLRGGLVSAIALLQLIAAVPVLAAGPAPALHLTLLVGWTAASLLLVRRAGLHLRVWTEQRAELTRHLVEAMIGHRTRVAQEPPERWHVGDDARLVDLLARERALGRSEAAVVAVVPHGWLVLGVAALLPGFVVGEVPAATIAVGIGGVLLAQRGLAAITGGASALLAAGVALRQAAPMLRATAEVDAGAHGLMLALPPVAEGEPLLIARGLGFRYPRRERPALHDVDLTIRVGDRVLLEGSSGGGKSTLGGVLAGLHAPGSGLVLLAGLDRATLGLAGWRRRVAAAPQFHDNHVFTAPFAFNLLMGRGWPPTLADLEEAELVCRELDLGELLDRMPGGLMQMVGETGWQLSHGERSRLFIARALLQRVEMIVLDESFAALDPVTLQRALACVLTRARTLVVIAHP